MSDTNGLPLDERVWPARATRTRDWSDTRDWSELGSSLRWLGGAMVGAAYVVPLFPSPGTLCPLRRLTGVPCPFCGLTTGVVAAAHGHPLAALGANPLAPVLVAATVAAWLVWALRRRRLMPAAGWAGRTVPAAWYTAAFGVSGLVVAGLWVFELHRFGFI